MSNPHQTIRIFISSPGDVAEEREGAKRVIAGLQRLYPNADLQAVLWEELTLPATASFQETIDYLLQREPIDIAVFILWSRLGSPLGPAITRPDGGAYRSGTEREFDLMLTAFEQSGRKRPIILAYLRDDDTSFREMLTQCPAAELEQIIQQRKLAECFVREQFHDAEGHNLRAYRTYSEPLGFCDQLKGQLRRTLDELLEVDKAITWTDEPYRGLESFDVQHAPIFFGRHEETCELLQLLRDQRRAGCAFVVIVGASGSGKSSLARAGVAANLDQPSGEGDELKWKISSFIPALTQQGLCQGLVRALGEAFPDLCDSDAGLDRIAKGLAENASLTVELTIAPALERARPPIGLLLILDQMEELWTDRHITDDNRESFLAACAALAESGYVSVLGTLRSDFFHHAQASPTFRKLKGKQSQFDLGPPDATAIHRLITEPARLAGLQFERNEQTSRSLDEKIWEDASQHSDALPLLEYTLSELYRQRDENRGLMTYAAYVELGGVEGAIGKRADETFSSLSSEAQAALDEVLPLLVSVDAGGEQSAVRRRASLAELTSTPARQTLTERLIADRFLTTDRQDDLPIASLAHEALLRSWDRIVSWINANREQLRLRARVEQTQQRWEQQDRDASLLLHEGLPLDEGRLLLRDAPYLLTDTTKDYINASIAHHERIAKQSRRLRTAVLSTIAALLVLLLVGGIVGWRINEMNKRIAADENRRTEASGLVQQLLKAETSDVPAVLENFPGYRDLTHENLVRVYGDPGENPKAKLHAALALLAEDASVLPFLKEQLLIASPVQVDTIATLLRPHKDELLADLWPILQNPSPDHEGTFLNIAGALAILDDENAEKWKAVSDRVTGKLIKEDIGRLTVWREILRPVAPFLVPSLGDVFRASPEVRPQREIDRATDVLESYVANDVEQLSDLLLDADPQQFTILFDEFEKASLVDERAIGKLNQEIDRTLSPDWNDPPIDSTWQEPSKELTERIEQADGLIAERFAFCQTLPLDEFKGLAEDLRKSGYRPIRLRPYAQQDAVHVAAAWTRDGRDWRMEVDESAQSILESDEQHRREGFNAIDTAGYVGVKDDEPAELYASLWVKQAADTADAQIFNVAKGNNSEQLSFKQSLQGFRGLDGMQKYSYVLTTDETTGEWSPNQTMSEFEAKAYLDKIHWDIDASRAADPETTQERNGKALAVAETQLNENPNDLSARFKRGIANFHLERDDAAMEDLDFLIEIAPQGASAYQYRSILHARNGRFEEAREDLARFTELSDSKTFQLYVDVIVSTYADDNVQAMEQLDSFVAESQDSGLDLYNAACMFSLAAKAVQDRDAEQSNAYASRAIDLLKQAMDVGYADYTGMQRDADLDPIRVMDGFEQIIKRGDSDLRYAAVWNQSTKYESRESHGLGPAEHLAECRAMQEEGYRPASISAASIDGKLVTASVWHRPLMPDGAKEALAQRQANAAVALLRLEKPEKVWPLFQHRPDPRLRSWIIHRLSPLAADPESILDRFDTEEDISVKRALLLCLGEFDEDQFPASRRESVSDKLLVIYREHPDAGLHGASEWLLRRWGLDERLSDATSDLQLTEVQLKSDQDAGSRQWYVNGQGQTFVVLDAPSFRMGSPASEADREKDETLHLRRLDRRFAIASTEVTVDQFEKFKRDQPTNRHTYTEKYAPEGSCPQISVLWYEAAWYCNWLSNQEGLPEEQWCYVPNEKTEFAVGMKVKDNFLELTGYRLPTESEWEYACRAGAVTSRYFGEGRDLLDRYAWTLDNSNERTWPVGSLKPNDFGLFDIQGNAMNWCYDEARFYPDNQSVGVPDRTDTRAVRDDISRVLRGGSFTNPTSFVRSAYRSNTRPDNRSNLHGFRVARTYHFSP